MDADIAARRLATYDTEAEEEARWWIEELTGEELQHAEFVKNLKDGVLLCKLANAIKPGTIRKINENTKLAFKLMDNITNFVRACKALGVPEHDVFDTIDLWEEKDVGLVVQTIHALGRTIQVTVPEYNGPILGPKLAQKNERAFTEDQRRAAAAAAALTGITAGSRGMERLGVSKVGSVTFGADHAGIGDSSVLSKFALGSQEYMERSGVDTSRDVMFGIRHAGLGDTTSVSSIMRGSHGIMQRSEVDKSHNITHGADQNR